MRNISSSLTTDQVRARTKTVTRRLGWAQLKPGTLLQPIEKGQGLKKGEHPVKIGGPIRVVSVRREPLVTLLRVFTAGTAEVRREGFPQMSPSEFVVFFARSNGLAPAKGIWSQQLAREVNRTIVTRIEFEYTEKTQ